MKSNSSLLLVSLAVLLLSFLFLTGGTWAESSRKAPDISTEPTKKARETPEPGEKKETTPPKPVTITANRMEVNRKLHIAVYIDNVVVKREDLTIYARRVEFLFDEQMKEIKKVTAEGGVRVVDPEKSATCDKAFYLNDQDILILVGNARVWQGENVITGSKMTLLRREDRSIVESEGKERITSVFYPNKSEEGESKVGMGALPKGKTDQDKSTKGKEK